MFKTYKYKLKPNATQKATFEQWLGTCRFLYNNALEHRITAYKSNGTSISKYEQYNELPAIKKELPWIADVHSDVLQEVLDRIDKAYKAFFNGSGFPKFQGKKFYNSFTFKRSYVVDEKTIKLPKIGEVRYYNSRSIVGKPKYATIKKEIDGWYICICCEQESKPITIDNSHAIGIDLGIAHFATFSDGSFLDTPLFLEPNLRKLRILQRKLSRQKKGSNSREKTKNQISKIHQKIKRQRTDFLHKWSTLIADEYSACYIEDLQIQNMLKLNSGLSRKMTDSGFYSFRQKLEYKFKERGKFFLAVAPHYTSQECNSCGHIDKKSRVSQSEFICTSCGHIENADISASKNIKAKGIRFSSERGALARA